MVSYTLDSEAVEKKQKKPAWAPCFYYRLDKEVFYYVGEEIVIDEGLDSFAGMIWPGVSSSLHYYLFFVAHMDFLCAPYYVS